jgi:hypothetical protein
MELIGAGTLVGRVLLHVIQKQNRAVEHGRKTQTGRNQQIKPHALPPGVATGSLGWALKRVRKLAGDKLGVGALISSNRSLNCAFAPLAPRQRYFRFRILLPDRAPTAALSSLQASRPSLRRSTRQDRRLRHAGRPDLPAVPRARGPRQYLGKDLSKIAARASGLRAQIRSVQIGRPKSVWRNPAPASKPWCRHLTAALFAARRQRHMP